MLTVLSLTAAIPALTIEIVSIGNSVALFKPSLMKKTKEEQKQKQKEQTLAFLRAPKMILYYYSDPRAKLSYTLHNGSKVYLLPQDNMPCIVPDMNQRNMPNISNPDEYFRSLALENQVPGKIPNAVTPYKIIPPTN